MSAILGSKTVMFEATNADDKIGKGTYGCAFKVTSKVDGRLLVLKRVDLSKMSRCKAADSKHVQKLKNTDQQSALMLEFARARDLSHERPRIVKTEDTWYDEPKFYIQMEYCHRGSLQRPFEDAFDQLQEGEIQVNELENQNPFVTRGGFPDFFGENVVPLEIIFPQMLEVLCFWNSNVLRI
jgi:serine/threonine protein kinase